MKISRATKPSRTQEITGGKSSSPRKAATPSSDAVELSGLFRELQTNEAEPAFDAAKVEQIKQAIAEGRFTINADAIADRLIASAKELIKARN